MMAMAGSSDWAPGALDEASTQVHFRHTLGKSAAWEKSNNRWWQAIESDCPISLTPISELQQPPFALQATGSSTPHYFDARVLANFLITSGDFINPMNRASLTRNECDELDMHVRRYYPKDGLASVTDAFDLFKKRDLNRKAGTDQVQREETAVLQHLFQFRSQRARRRTNALAGSGDAAGGSSTFAALDELFPALNSTGYSPATAMPKRCATAPQQTRRRLLLRAQPSVAEHSTATLVDDAAHLASRASENIDQATLDAESSLLLAEAEAAIAAEAVNQRSSTRSSTIVRESSTKWTPQFLNPIVLLAGDAMPSVSACGEEDRDSVIMEELDVLTSIYGEDAVSWTRSQDEQQRPCWQIRVARSQWHLHLLVPSDMPYPRACPLLCPQNEDQCLTPEKAERIVSALGETAQHHLGEPFIFNLVESLSNIS